MIQRSLKLWLVFWLWRLRIAIAIVSHIIIVVVGDVAEVFLILFRTLFLFLRATYLAHGLVSIGSGGWSIQILFRLSLLSFLFLLGLHDDIIGLLEPAQWLRQINCFLLNLFKLLILMFFSPQLHSPLISKLI